MSNYTNNTLEEKLKKCIDIVRLHMGEPTNKLGRYNQNQNETDKFYVVSKERKLTFIRNGQDVEAGKMLAMVLELKSGNCGEYGLYSRYLLQLKGFKTYCCIEDFGNDNHCYSIIKHGDLFWTVDAWNKTVGRINALPIQNNAVSTEISNQKISPLTTKYWNDDLFQDINQSAVGYSNATAKLKYVEKNWK